MAEFDLESRASVPEEEEVISDYTSSGRYIPYQGGSMGWSDNAGVMKSEVRNNYRYHTIMEAAEVKTAQFFRAGEQFGQRRAKTRLQMEIPTVLVWQEGSQTALSHDISPHGIRLQFMEEMTQPRGTSVTVQLLNQEATEIQLEIPSQVVWVSTSGVTRTLWNVGISFTGITGDLEARLTEFIAGS